MGNFEDRKIFYKDTCLHCKHCYPFEVFWECESARTEELFCMDEEDDLCDSRRIVGAANCCQFFEHE